jgi:hypothetical protein
MKFFGPVLALFLTVTSLLADATAYQALEYYSGSRKNAFDNIFVVRGEGGLPQPGEWTLFRGRSNGPSFQTTAIKANGVILTGDAPARVVGLEPHAQEINFSVLNVDSNAAWQIAKREARKEGFKFGRVDYVLKTNPIAGVPAWSMRLFNEGRATVGELTISGATGEILYPLKLYRYAVEEVDGQPTLATVREPWITRATRSVGRWFGQTGRAYGKDLVRATGTAEEIVVGERTRHFADDAR